MSRLLIFFLIPFTALAQLANRPPAPLWLSSAEAVMISKDVRHEGKLLKAVLLTAGDADMEISVDGKLVAKLKAAEAATGTGNDQRFDTFIGAQRAQGVADVVDQAFVQAVERSGAIERERGDAFARFDKDVFVSHRMVSGVVPPSHHRT